MSRLLFRKMGTEKPTGEHPDKLANGVNGHSGNGTTMERSNSVQHFDGKGKDVIPLYRYGAVSVQHGPFQRVAPETLAHIRIRYCGQTSDALLG